MNLWVEWIKFAMHLRETCKRRKTYIWLLFSLIAMTVRRDYLGVTSYVRATGLKPSCYKRLLDFFHTSAINADYLAHTWSRLVIRFFPGILRVNNRLVLLADGIKVAKSGKKMPGVKLLHQESENNSKGEFILGHSCQSIALVCSALSSHFAVPLISRIHEGFNFCNKIKVTMLDKLLNLLDTLNFQDSYYLVADNYYANAPMIKGLLAKGNHLITRVKLNAVAYETPLNSGRIGAGRPKTYGTKLALKKLFDHVDKFTEADSPVYGEKKVKIKYAVAKLIWKSSGEQVMFIAVSHPNRGKILLLCTDLEMDPVQAIKLYALRFKIELSFKNSVHVIGAYAYRFWMQSMSPTKRDALDVDFFDLEHAIQSRILKKLNAYHIHIQVGLIAQGLLQYLACKFPQQVWNSFGSWLRTIRSNIPPSEMVTSMALTNTLPKFLSNYSGYPNLAKFFADNVDLDRFEGLRLVA